MYTRRQTHNLFNLSLTVERCVGSGKCSVTIDADWSQINTFEVIDPGSPRSENHSHCTQKPIF